MERVGVWALEPGKRTVTVSASDGQAAGDTGAAGQQFAALVESDPGLSRLAARLRYPELHLGSTSLLMLITVAMLLVSRGLFTAAVVGMTLIAGQVALVYLLAARELEAAWVLQRLLRMLCLGVTVFVVVLAWNTMGVPGSRAGDGPPTGPGPSAGSGPASGNGGSPASPGNRPDGGAGGAGGSGTAAGGATSTLADGAEAGPTTSRVGRAGQPVGSGAGRGDD